MNILRATLLTIGVLLLFLCVWVYLSVYSPSVKGETVFSISQGASVGTIAKELQRSNLIPSAFMFKVLVRLTHSEHRIRAGEYLIAVNTSPVQIVEQFVSGTMRMVSVTIPEGLPWWEVASRFEREGLVLFSDFKMLMYDKTFLAEQGITFSSAEGFLYPETYFFVKPSAPSLISTKNVITTMIQMYKQQTRGLFPPSYSREEEYKTLILASIVEKEAKQKEERARIAGVYLNRIRINMILQADPTIIYGLGPSFEGRLRRVHLVDTENPYNTYKIAGLPPTPICSPSRAVIEAVLNPERHKYLYFVATKQEGWHFFSTNLQDHNKAVQKYQIDQ